MMGEREGPARVLIVDDNPTNLKLMSNLMERAGYHPLAAENGEQGVRFAARGRPDVILLDILMPGIDGFETCRRLKASDETKEIPVIFMTAVTQPDQKVRAFDLGAVDYITKPFQTEEVLARVRTQLALRRQMKLAAEKKKMESVLTLIGGIAHRFNNQLYVVKGNLDLMGEEPALPDDLRRYLDPAAKAADEMAGLTRRLLIYTNYDQSKPEPTDLNRYLSERIDALRADLPPGVRIETALSEGESTVPVDRSRMEAVLTAVIDNAREAMGDGGGTIRIATEKIGWTEETAETDAEETEVPMVRISIADTGAGMDEAIRERVFDPFFSTKFLGRGMSMAAALGIVRGHGGVLSVTSAPGRGTTVYIDLPLVEEKGNARAE